jgi:HSP20 family molecular chaperone IbpA
MKKLMLHLAFGIVLLTGQVFGQPSPDLNPMEQRFRLREKLHQRMLDQMLSHRMEDDFFKDMDQMMNQVMKEMESFGSSFQAFGSQKGYQSEWSESNTGRTLVITPDDPKNPLDINVKSGFITIKGKTQNEQISSQFSHSMKVPGDVEADKVKMTAKENKVYLFFPYAKGGGPQKIPGQPQDRQPLKPNGEGVEV